MSQINFYNVGCMDFMRDKPDKFYKLAIVDPPYGIGEFTKVGDANFYKKKADKKYGRVNWNDKIPDELYFKELIRISVNRIIWGANYYWQYIPEKSFIVWYKGNDASRWSKCEIASTTIGVNQHVEFLWNGFLRCEQTERIHACQKPVQLYRWILQNYAKPGDNILDTHGGSMSSAIACDMEGYDLDICELDKEYFDAGVKRFQNYKLQGKLF